MYICGYGKYMKLFRNSQDERIDAEAWGNWIGL